MHVIRAVVSTYHQVIWFPNEAGIIKEVLGDQITSKQCFVTVNDSYAAKGFVQMVEELEKKEMFQDVGRIAEQKAVEDLVEVRIDETDPEKFLLGSSLSSTERKEIIDFLISDLEVFAWMSYDMLGIDPNFICDQLNVNPTAKSVIQRTRWSALHHAEVVVKEVGNLLETSAIKEVHYPKWISNTAKKEWQMTVCVDYKTVNKACLKDSFPLSMIDQLVDLTAGHNRLSFLDA